MNKQTPEQERAFDQGWDSALTALETIVAGDDQTLFLSSEARRRVLDAVATLRTKPTPDPSLRTR